MNIKLPACYDASHWEIVSDFASVLPRPYLVITKATEGTNYTDDTFAPYFRDLAQDGIFRGAYHFFRKAYDATLQAKFFCDTLRPLGIKDDDLLALDIEEGGETASQLETWIRYVASRFPSNKILIYSRKNILDPIVMSSAQKTFFRQFSVWTAGYPDNPDIYSSVPSFYTPDQSKWGVVWLWQYSDDGIVSGVNGAIDCNWVSPSLMGFLGKQPSTLPTGVTMKEGTAKVDLNIRSGIYPAPVIGILRVGDKVYGDIDASSGWLHFFKVLRSNGAIETFDGWCSGASTYITIVDYTTTPPSSGNLPDLNVTISAMGYPTTTVTIKPA